MVRTIFYNIRPALIPITIVSIPLFIADKRLSAIYSIPDELYRAFSCFFSVLTIAMVRWLEGMRSSLFIALTGVRALFMLPRHAPV